MDSLKLLKKSFWLLKIDEGVLEMGEKIGLSDINIGENAVIGLGSVILKDISPDTTVAGNPGNVIKKSR